MLFEYGVDRVMREPHGIYRLRHYHADVGPDDYCRYSRRIYIGPVSPEVTLGALKDFFSTYGPVAVKWLRRPRYISSRPIAGSAYAVFESSRSVRSALDNTRLFDSDRAVAHIPGSGGLVDMIYYEPWVVGQETYITFTGGEKLTDYANYIVRIVDLPHGLDANSSRCFGLTMDYTRILVDDDTKFPTGIACVVFRSRESYLAALMKNPCECPAAPHPTFIRGEQETRSPPPLEVRRSSGLRDSVSIAIQPGTSIRESEETDPSLRIQSIGEPLVSRRGSAADGSRNSNSPYLSRPTQSMPSTDPVASFMRALVNKIFANPPPRRDRRQEVVISERNNAPATSLRIQSIGEPLVSRRGSAADGSRNSNSPYLSRPTQSMPSTDPVASFMRALVNKIFANPPPRRDRRQEVVISERNNAPATDHRVVLNNRCHLHGIVHDHVWARKDRSSRGVHGSGAKCQLRSRCEEGVDVRSLPPKPRILPENWGDRNRTSHRNNIQVLHHLDPHLLASVLNKQKKEKYSKLSKTILPAKTRTKRWRRSAERGALFKQRRQQYIRQLEAQCSAVHTF
ncbi:hypothetical protein OSTOST_03407 [Ostertagia ostertagi]